MDCDRARQDYTDFLCALLHSRQAVTIGKAIPSLVTLVQSRYLGYRILLPHLANSSLDMKLHLQHARV